MTIYIQSDLREEIVARKKYIFDVFGVYSIETCERSNFIKLISIPENFENDLIFFVGHHNAINNFLNLDLNIISNKSIVLITCKANDNYISLSRCANQIYLARQKDNYAVILDKDDYGFDFDPVESEVIMYNLKNKYPIYQILNKAFICMWEKTNGKTIR